MMPSGPVKVPNDGLIVMVVVLPVVGSNIT